MFGEVGDILLMLACQHLHSRIYSTLPFMTICCIYHDFSIARTEGMCSLNDLLAHNGVDHML